MAHEYQGRATESPAGAIMGPGYAILASQRWRTPPSVLRSVVERVGPIALDAAAEEHTSAGARCLTADDDCLGPDPWPLERGQVGWINPPWGGRGVSRAAREAFPAADLAPFPGTGAFVKRALEECRRARATVVCLLPHALDSAWQRAAAREADEVWIGRRVRYLDAITGEPAGHPPGGTLAIVYRSHVPVGGWPGGPRVDLGWGPR